MILFYNVYLADEPPKLGGKYYRGLYSPWVDTIDVFKYTLSSVSQLYPWSRVIINCEICDSLKHRTEELNNYINNLFQGQDLLLSNKRLERQSEWKDNYVNLNNDLIYFSCNHDHVFVDSNTLYFADCIEEFKKEPVALKSLYFSHWYEVNTIFLHDVDESRMRETYAFTTHPNFDSIQIISKQVYHDWWFPGSFEDKFLPRTDYFDDVIPNQPNKLTAVPYRELFRHFDGYTHVHSSDRNWQTNVLRDINVLNIPPGFFDNNLKLRFGYEENKPDYVNINLGKDNYTSLDVNGTDYKFLTTEIPYFWKNIITETDINTEYTESLFTNKVNKELFNRFSHFDGLNHFGNNIPNILSNNFIMDKIKQSHNIG